MVARDSAGTLYSALSTGYPPTADGFGQQLPGRLFAVDPASQTRLWWQPGSYEVLTGLDDGVLAVRDKSTLVAFSSSGLEVWSRPLAGWPVTVSDEVYGSEEARSPTVIFDRDRNRLYVGRFDGAPGVMALAASTGALVWRSRPADRARLLSVGRSGRAYLAVNAPKRRGVRAVRIAGGAAWERRTAEPVRGARELADGTVAVSSGLEFGVKKYTPTTHWDLGPSDQLILLRPSSG